MRIYANLPHWHYRTVVELILLPRPQVRLDQKVVMLTNLP